MVKRIPFLRGWAILAVVCHHATNWAFIAMFWWGHRYHPVNLVNYDQTGGLSYYVLTAINQMALFSVPAFLFISGLFITYAARGSSPVLSWKVVKARLLNLFWPYLIWSILIFIWDGLLGTVYSPAEYLTKLMTGGAVGPYFFVPLLAQLYLLSPLLVRWAKDRPGLLLAVSALLLLSVVGVPYLGSFWGSSAAPQVLKILDWVFIGWAFFFILGMVVGFRRKQVWGWLARYKRVLLAATMLLGVLSVVESQLIYRATSDWDWAYATLKLSSISYAVAFILSFLAWDARPSTFDRVVERLGGISYGIYLIHPKVLELMARVIYHVAPGILAQQLVLVFLLVVLVLGGCWLLMTVVARSPIRRVYRYLFG
jgi:peptidoglycan/LPS O-acetylase OafA/YrhL